MTQAFFEAGVPREAISVYPGLGEVGAAVLNHCPRSLIFGGTATVEQYAGNPSVQVHGPGFSKILVGDDVVDDWEQHLDLMVDSVLINSGRGCINCSGIWASRHTREIATARGRAAGSGAPAAAGGPGGGAGRVHGTWPGQGDLCQHRRPRRGVGCRGGDGEVSCRGATGRAGALRLPVSHGAPLRLTGRGSGQDGVHVPVRHGGAVPARADAGDRSVRRSSQRRSRRTRRFGARWSTPTTSTGSTWGRCRQSNLTGCSPTRVTSSTFSSGRARSRWCRSLTRRPCRGVSLC